MNNKKKPTERYETANQIRDEIDASKERVRHKLAAAEAYDIEADNLFKAGPTYQEDAVFKRSQAKILRRQVHRIETIRIPKLSEKLAEFQTELLPGVIKNGDRSVARRLK